MNVFTIAARELRSLFVSPLPWAVLAITQAFVAYAFLVKLELFLQLKPHLPGLPGAPRDRRSPPRTGRRGAPMRPRAP